MEKLLIVVDMQNDFINGVLGTAEAQAIVPNVIAKINGWDGDIIATLDTHSRDYFKTREGKYLPVEHCIEGAEGHNIDHDVFEVLLSSRNFSALSKRTFGSTALPEIIRHTGVKYVELVGVCTDICVISNALLLKAAYPELDIAVDASCCAGTTPHNHQAALDVMRSCQIDILRKP